MQDLRKAAQQALEALEIANNSVTPQQFFDEEIAALRAALAEDAMQRLTDVQQEMEMEATCQESRQVEPVAWLIESYDIYAKRTLQRLVFDNPKNMQGVKITAYYTAPPKGEPISTDMILATWVEECIPKRSTPELVVAFARAIERAAHGIGGEE